MKCWSDLSPWWLEIVNRVLQGILVKCGSVCKQETQVWGRLLTATVCCVLCVDSTVFTTCTSTWLACQSWTGNPRPLHPPSMPGRLSLSRGCVKTVIWHHVRKLTSETTLENGHLTPHYKTDLWQHITKLTSDTTLQNCHLMQIRKLTSDTSLKNSSGTALENCHLALH